jgi:DNA polymerase III subunit epsilon
MRQVVLDTETTGLEVSQGHRVIEIGCIEIVNRRQVREFHTYLCPDRAIDAGATEVHGITNEFLAGKPRFSAVAQQFLDLVTGAELVIHNADFDVGFLNNEIRLWNPKAGRLQDLCQVLDTLAFARKLHPGQRNSLDALCRRYGVDNSGREYHGARLDAQLLTEVYLAMTGGQTALFADSVADVATPAIESAVLDRSGMTLKVVRASQAELSAHEAHLSLIDKCSGGQAMWRRLS